MAVERLTCVPEEQRSPEERNLEAETWALRSQVVVEIEEDRYMIVGISGSVKDKLTEEDSDAEIIYTDLQITKTMMNPVGKKN